MASDLSPEHKESWIAFFVASGLLIREIDERLKQAGAIGMDVYDVLLALEMAPGQRLRMVDLSKKVLLTRSGITRMVDRLERDGLVERKSCPSDRRCLYAALTAKGLAERERAWPIYQKGIADLFAAHITEGEANVMCAALRKVAFANGVDLGVTTP